MEFAKTISCGEMDVEITANTHAVIVTDEKLKSFDLDEIVKTYGNSPAISEIVHEIDRPVAEIPFQVDFWQSFCYVLNKSVKAGFLGVEGSKCLSKACRSVVPEKKEYTYTEYRDADEWEICFGEADKDGKIAIGKKKGYASYEGCKNIQLDNRDHIVIIAKYGQAGKESVRINYPCDYLELLENVESYLAKKAHSKKMHKGAQMIMDFLTANREEIGQFKRYASKIKKKESLKKKLNEMYHAEDSLIVDGKGFLEKYCGFDIYEKKQEIDAIVKKLQNSSDEGEDEVEYAIKWLCAESPFHFKTIKKDCETKYRYGCILLKKDDFIDEPQEYDHILVSDSGIFLIETKNWKGRVEIRPDGKWIRDTNNDGCLEGVESPLYQIQRHEAIVKSILPSVPIHSLLVFSNPKVILEGVKIDNVCRVLYVDRLKETVINILSNAQPVAGTIDYCVNEIEKYKINIMDDNIRELQ